MHFFAIFSFTILTIFGFLLVHGEESSSMDNHVPLRHKRGTPSPRNHGPPPSRVPVDMGGAITEADKQRFAKHCDTVLEEAHRVAQRHPQYAAQEEARQRLNPNDRPDRGQRPRPFLINPEHLPRWEPDRP